LEAAFGFQAGKHVTPPIGLVEGGVDNRKGIDRTLQRQRAQEFALLLGELRARVTNGRQRHVVEVFDFAALGGLFVVVALHNGAAERADDFEAFARIGVVAHDVANAHRMSHGLSLHILQYGFEGLEVTVDVSKNAESHAYSPSNRSEK